MAKLPFSQYRDHDLNSLVDKLCNEYYTTVDSLCKNAVRIVSELEQEEVHPSTVLYMSLSTKLLDQVDDFINLRVGVIVPYVQELHTKQNEGHDCSSCAGGCHIRHTSQLAGLKESHKKIKEILYRLQMVALPLYTDIDYPDNYKSLRNEMMQIDTALTELFYLEESSLIPKIMEAQKFIHAYN